MQNINYPKLNALLIDDEEFISKLITRLLNEMGIKNIITASDGLEGLEKYKKVGSKLDLVICDLEMPNMNGFEFVASLRALPEAQKPDIPILILTGHSDETHVHEAVRLGINGFLIKPVSKATLEKRIATALTMPGIDPKALG